MLGAPVMRYNIYSNSQKLFRIPRSGDIIRLNCNKFSHPVFALVSDHALLLVISACVMTDDDMCKVWVLSGRNQISSINADIVNGSLACIIFDCHYNKGGYTLLSEP